jgi:hypothetical protein
VLEPQSTTHCSREAVDWKSGTGMKIERIFWDVIAFRPRREPVEHALRRRLNELDREEAGVHGTRRTLRSTDGKSICPSPAGSTPP